MRDCILVEDGCLQRFLRRWPAACYCSTKMAITRKEGRIRHMGSRSFFIVFVSSIHHRSGSHTLLNTLYIYFLRVGHFSRGPKHSLSITASVNKSDCAPYRDPTFSSSKKITRLYLQIRFVIFVFTQESFQ